MNEQLLTLYRFEVGFVARLMQDVGEDQLAHQPAEGINTPGWIMGHLALVNEMAASILGGEKTLPESWKAEFGLGSDPLPIGDGYPAKEELLGEFRRTSEALAALVKKADLGALDTPNPIENLRPGLPTLGDLIGHVLSTHIATHAGQLSTWRRAMGHGPLI